MGFSVLGGMRVSFVISESRRSRGMLNRAYRRVAGGTVARVRSLPTRARSGAVWAGMRELAVRAPGCALVNLLPGPWFTLTRYGFLRQSGKQSEEPRIAGGARW